MYFYRTLPKNKHICISVQIYRKTNIDMYFYTNLPKKNIDMYLYRNLQKKKHRCVFL